MSIFDIMRDTDMRDKSEVEKYLHKHLGSSAKWNGPLRPELLTFPGIPLPMHGVSPRVVLGSAWWNRERRKAFESTDFHCLACGISKYEAQAREWLEGHEVYKIDYKKGRMTFKEVVPLCHYCHAYCHPGRLDQLLMLGHIHHAKYAKIIQHGDAILLQANLSREIPDTPAYLMAPWGKWRLVIGRRRFKPKYASYDEYAANNRME